MFTGIVTDVGRVRAIGGGNGADTRFDLETRYDTDDIAIGASISCAGVCLTVVDKGPGRFAVEASGETLARTTIGAWRPGSRVNLERALKVGDELGGHFVSGHVDGVGQVVSSTPEGGSTRFVFEAPDMLRGFLAPKGAIAIDGVSLTVNEAEGPRFGVNVIQHTRSITTFGSLRPEDPVNLEVDLLARYLAHLLEER